MTIRLLLLLLATIGLHAADAPPSGPPRAGSVLWRLDPATMKPAAIPGIAAWVPEGPDGRLCFKTTVPEARKKEMLVARIPIDLTACRGMIVSLSCMARTEGVSKPTYDYNGVKCMLYYKSASSGEVFKNEGRVYGTFDWRQLNTSTPIAADATDGLIMLGTQDCSGTAWIADVTLTALAVRPVRPVQAAPLVVVPEGLRRRGVMSSNLFNEKDFVDLRTMKANAMRWQIGRNWGKTGGDRDLEAYDKWLDGKLVELDKALVAAKANGIKLLIDLHSPPGGRLPDTTLCMVLEEKYQRHFVEVWRRIATRCKGNPAVWGYDLINEPVQQRPSPPGLADWLGVQVMAGKAIRSIDPDTPIFIESDDWDNPQRYDWMEPVDLTNVVYEAHMYFPGAFTHQGVGSDWGVGGGEGHQQYPGRLNGEVLDRSALVKHLKPLRDFQLAYGVPVMIGEFSAARWAPGADRYLADCTSIFEEYGWDWTYHAFREWQGWSFEHEDMPYDRKDGLLAKVPTARARVLLDWFARNAQAP